MRGKRTSFKNFFVFDVLSVAPSRYRGSTGGTTYQRMIHESKDVLKLLHVLSSVVLSCRHDLAKVGMANWLYMYNCTCSPIHITHAHMYFFEWYEISFLTSVHVYVHYDDTM